MLIKMSSAQSANQASEWMNAQWGWEQAMFRDKIQASDNKKKEKSPEVF